jgi:dienelactone hydrolase
MSRPLMIRACTFIEFLFCVGPCFAGPTLMITPQQGLIDEPLRILVDGLSPRQEFVIRGITRVDAQNTLASYAGFRADGSGHAQVENEQPVSGTYSRGEMGLLWSMTKEAVPERFQHDLTLPFPAAATDPSTVLFELEVNGQVVATDRVWRLFARPDVKAIDVRENGLVGRLFLPAVKRKAAAVVLVGGSEGGLETGAARGMLLASRGYVTLALAYFRAEGLPNQLVSIPLETVRRACTYLSHRPEVDAQRIGIIGASRGAELALLAASILPELRAVVAYAPSNASWAAIASGPQQAAWTFNGQPIPFVPNPSAELIAGFKQMTAGLPPRSLQGLILSYAHAVERAEIPVERINGPVLLVSGLEDRLWPSSAMADLIVTRLREHGVPSGEHLSFSDAGHIINFPFLPTATRTQLGGTVEGLARADAESWKRVLTFLASNLRQHDVRH